MGTIIILTFWIIVFVGIGIAALIDGYENKKKREIIENNLQYPMKTPIRLFSVKHILHWRLDEEDFFDMGEVTVFNPNGTWEIDYRRMHGPTLEGIRINTPDDLNKWREKFKTLRDIKVWKREQEESLKNAIKINEGNFE